MSDTPEEAGIKASKAGETLRRLLTRPFQAKHKSMRRITDLLDDSSITIITPESKRSEPSGRTIKCIVFDEFTEADDTE